MKEGFSSVEVNPEGGSEKKIPQKKVGLTRRDFIRAGLATLGATALSGVLREEREDGSDSRKENTAEDIAQTYAKENIGEVLTPLEQLQIYGEIKSLEEGLRVYHDQHYKKLTSTDDGMKDMYDAVSNMSTFDVQKMIEPFEKKGLSKDLAYMIAIQETRGQNKTSPAGAVGVTGIMPATAKVHGHTTKELEDPYIASKITAQYLADERDARFGDDEDMLLHAYNAGGGLYGFTKTVPKGERNSRNFYEYMEKYINTIFSEVKKHGYYTHTLDKSDKTLSHVSKRFEVPLEDIIQANNLTKDSPIHLGDTLIIPFDDMKHAAKIVFRKPLEAVQYTPEVRAKYDALRDSGLVKLLDVR